MKKKMIGLCALLTAVVMTGYSVSGTYAKYTVSKVAGDEARVAKWGIDTTKTINLFDTSYVSSDNPAATDVVSDPNGDGMKVVAPGTSGVYAFTLGGSAPETNYTLSVVDNGSVDGTVDAATSKGQIVYYLKSITGDTTNLKFADVGFTDSDKVASISDLVTKINDKYANKVFAANSTDDSVYAIGWEWKFEDAANMTENDSRDTNLGNKTTLDTVKLDITITATQSESQPK